MTRIKRTDIIIIAVILAFSAFVAVNILFSSKHSGASSYSDKVTDYTDYNGKKIGIKTSSAFEEASFTLFPDSEYYYYDSTGDLTAALVSNKIDAFLEDEPVARRLRIENSSVSYLKKPLIEDDYSFAFTKANPLSEKYVSEFNKMLTEMKENGELEQLKDKWTGSSDPETTSEKYDLTGENGTIKVSLLPDVPPFTYLNNDAPVGYAVDLINIFAEKYGYSLEFEYGNAAACFAGLGTGKYDVLIGPVSVTEERKENMYFTDTIYNGGSMLVLRADEISSDIDPLQMNDPSYTLGVATGSSGMLAAEKYLPNAKLLMFDDNISAYEAVKLGKIDAYIYDRKQMETAIENGLSGVKLLGKDLGEPVNVAVGISRKTSIPDLTTKLNGFLNMLKSDGTLDEMNNRWIVEKNYEGPDIPKPESPDMKIVVGTTGIVEPYSFYMNGELSGFDIELSKRFAAYINADIEYRVYNYSGIITAANSNEIDCIFANLNVTEERKEKIDFSDPIYTANIAFMVQDNDTGDSSSWLSSLKDSFNKNFIREDRYKLIIRGTKTTCFITFMSVLFGTVLAFLICLFRRTDSILAGGICNLYVKLIQGTPIVVLLMIMYYIIFEKSDITAERVAIIGFSLNFSAYASEILRSGIESVDKGQREAALALGYSENQTFFRFVFPQAAVRSLPVYRGEVISLLKNTSIVGYIAVQDLNKMADIIRSRTYEAFFPLIFTAVIYFILAWIISILLNLLLKQIDPKRRKRTAKGALKK